MEDQQLNQTEERDAFVLGILASCHKALHVYASGLCAKFGFDPSSAADALQEFYVKLIAKYPDIAKSYEKHGPPYLFTMVRREVLTMHRKAKSLKRIHHMFGEMSPKAASLFSYSAEESINRLLHSVEKLLSETDLAILYYYLQGYSMKEIGELMPMHPSTVGVRIHRAKLRLAPYFSGRGS
ncbi:MAG: RNA polymerase sigma factor [Lewinellaceae bacterium]|nr:RNA polymerase sigma factor [Lewinellaceae bacterium]